MQSALDSTALMVSKDLTSGVITTSQINSAAQNYFNALYTDRDAAGGSDQRDVHGGQRQHNLDRS